MYDLVLGGVFAQTSDQDCPISIQLEHGSEEKEHDEEEEEEGDEEGDEEGRSSPSDPEEEVSTAVRAKQLAERIQATARKVLRDLGRILAIILLALAGTSCVCLLSCLFV